ncbi:MAG TPA: efflux RND transporter permease subunit, partial [Aggregicoccus sp.]|nr:efflux RND transporter permease subunit [Aggregicoccus sp.]
MRTEGSLIDRLLGASFAKPGLTLVLALAAAAFGVAAFQGLNRDVFPDLSAPLFNVIVQNPAMAAEELETAVAIPLEAALSGLPQVRRIRSTSQLGVSTVTVEFEPDADYFRSRQYVAERVAQAASELPPGTDAPLVSSLTGRLNEIFEFTLEAKEGVADLMALRDLAEFEVKNRLLAVPGVAGVERLGGYLREYQVLLDPEQMSARGVTLDEVQHALEGANENASGGFLVQGSMEWTVRAMGRAGSLEDLRGTVVAVRGGTPVLLGDVADVREGPAVRRGLAHRLSGEVVSARVVKQFGADTVSVARDIRAALDDVRKTLPEGVTLRVVYDQSQLVSSALGGVTRAILIGALLVILVLFALLGDWRAALIVTLSLPLSIALAGILLQRAGVGINTMTLGGLAIAVGLLVDASIIVTENIVHRLRPGERGAQKRERARGAASEVARPITYATLIVVAVFIPLFAMGGIEGRMYQPLAAAVVACLAASLLLALTLVPVASALFLRAKAPGAPEDVWLIRRVKALYAPLLDGAMRHAGRVRVATLALTLPALALGFAVGTDFMPRLDEGALLIQTMLPAEASLEEVDRLNHRVEDVLRGFPEVEEVVRRTG